MKGLSDYAFRLRPVVFLVLVLAMAYGAFSYFTLPAREDPQITVREAVVSTAYPGMDAERVERLITTPIAEALKSIPEHKEIRATSMEGQSIIHIETEFEFGDLEQIWDEVADKVDEVRPSLPEGAMEPRINDDFGDVAVITLALQSDDFDMFELGDLAEHIRNQLYTVDGTRKVDILGRPQERVYIEIENAVQAELGVPISTVASQLRAQNIVRPGGAIETDTKRISIEPSGSFDSIAEIENLYIDLGPDTGSVRLGDYATVTKSVADPPGNSAYFNGEPAIVFAISMLESESVLNYAERASEQIDKVRSSLPAGVTLETMTYQADQVEDAVYGVSINVVQTLAIVLGVVILFLGLRTGLIVGSIVPAVVLVTFAVMGIYQIQLERMSLATIVIGLGLLVDNGIVIAEDYKMRLSEGVSKRDAIGETGSELSLPLLASSLTTILVFLPLMLAQHTSGEYTRNISIIILVALSASWLIAMTVTPTLCYWFVKSDEEETKGRIGKKVDELFEAANTRYEAILRRLLAHRKRFLVAMLVLFVASGASIGFVQQQFFPSSDRAQILIYADMPVGTSSAAMDETVADISRYIGDEDRYPDFGGVASYAGFGGPRFVLSLAPTDPAPNRGFFVVNAADAEARDAGIERLRTDLAREFPDTRLRISGMFLGPSDPNILQVQVRGPDTEVLEETGTKLAAIFRSVDGTIDVFSNWENPSMQMRIDVDQAAARAAGVTSNDIAGSLATYFSGQPVGEYREGDDVVPIVLRAPGDERTDPGRVESVTIFPANGGVPVPLGQVATPELVPQPGRIQTEDLVNTLTIEGRPTEVTPEDMVPMVQDRIDALEAELPPGHFIEWDGIIEQSGEGRSALFAFLPIMIGLIVVMLVAQFGGFRRAGIILLTIPLCLIGAAIGLHVMGASFGFMVILGLFSLAGIIINNAIVLVDRIDIERGDKQAENDDLLAAIIRACLRRFRPILMTTVTTILGLLPLILAQDVLFYGLASVIAWGLLVGTVLTLGVVPVLYAMFFGADEKTGEVQHVG